MNVTQHFIERDDVRLCATLHRPDAHTHAGILLCPPLFEERKSAGRALAEAAGTLCSRGCTVLRFDYSGCGDSSGDLDSFTIRDWFADIACAQNFLKEHLHGPPSGIAGLRLGASLAALHLAGGGQSAFLILWEPVIDGNTYIRQELRRSLTREMVTFGKNRRSSADLIADLEHGKSVDLDGYSLSPALYADFCGLNLAMINPPPVPGLLLNISHRDTLSPALSELQAKWEPNTTFQVVQLQPFWNLVGYIDASPVIRRTGEWLAARLPGETRHDQEQGGTQLPAAP